MLLPNKRLNENKINHFINNLEQTEILELGNLRLELFNRKDYMEYEFLTLSNALQNDYIKIEEISNSGSVPELKCKNLSEKLILILAGEEIVGAKQNRITNISFILPPHFEIKIPVSCVEQGRWSYKSRKFSKGTNAYPDLKRKLYEDVIDNNTKGYGYQSNQSRIWSDIEQKQRSFNKYSTTSAMNEMYDLTDELNNFLNQNKHVFGCGMASFINGGLTSFEMMPNEIFFNRIFSDLVKSVYQESLLYRNRSTTYSTFLSSNAFFNYLQKLNSNKNKGVGLGDNNHIQSHSVCGDFLSLDDDIIHLYSFPKKNHL